jgi:uncharacterized protein
MAAPPRLRRQDLVMPLERTLETLKHGFCGRLGSVGADGYPYCVPLLYVQMDGEIYVHNTRATGHLHANVEREARFVSRLMSRVKSMPMAVLSATHRCPIAA